MDYTDLRNYKHLMKEIIELESAQAMALGRLLLDRWYTKSVIDVGCGPGVYLLPYKSAGCDVLGIDGCDAAGESLDPTEFELVDLREPWTPPREFDMSLCVEVAEHIPEQYADVFMDTLCKCAPLCCFSAAHPGQGGSGHFNCQDRSYWIAKFIVRGFYLDDDSTHALHSVIDVDPVYKTCGWLRWNFMVLRRT